MSKEKDTKVFDYVYGICDNKADEILESNGWREASGEMVVQLMEWADKYGDDDQYTKFMTEMAPYARLLASYDVVHGIIFGKLLVAFYKAFPNKSPSDTDLIIGRRSSAIEKEVRKGLSALEQIFMLSAIDFDMVSVFGKEKKQ